MPASKINRPHFQRLNPVQQAFCDTVLREKYTLDISTIFTLRPKVLGGVWTLDTTMFPRQAFGKSTVQMLEEYATRLRKWADWFLANGFRDTAYQHYYEACELSYYRLRPACGYNCAYHAHKLFLKYNNGDNNV